MKRVTNKQKISLQNLLVNYFERNKAPGYRLNVTHVSDNKRMICFDFVFIKGKSYCCSEVGCHFLKKRFIEYAFEHHIKLSQKTQIMIHVVIEKGAIFKYYGGESEFYEYDQEF